MPRVSVIVPAYNVAQYLREAIASVLAQTFQDFEIIIVDDASTDGTGELAEQLAREDARIRVIHHTENKYASGARNSGIAAMRGEYMSQLDGDDLYTSDKLERQVAYMDAHPDVDMVYSDFEILHEVDGRRVFRPAVVLPDDPAQILRDAQHDETIMGLHPHQVLGRHDEDRVIPVCAVLIRRRVFDVVRYDPDQRIAEDYDLWFQIIGHGFKLAHLPFLSYSYRQHPSQTTRNTDAMESSRVRVIKKIRDGAYFTGTRGA